MSDIKKMKVKNDYKKVEDSIGSSTDYKGLQHLYNKGNSVGMGVVGLVITPTQ